MVDIDINELKRVLNGLEYCIQEDTPFADCPRCPYYTSERCMQELRSDAYSVLLSIYRHETRKAKLLTIDEVKTGPADMYLERRLYYKGKWTSVLQAVTRMWAKDTCIQFYAMNLKFHDYNTSNHVWRCWNKRPTEQQMKETEWNGNS